jgi:PBSX family phage terminase large subunit
MINYAPFDTKQSEYLKKSLTSWLNVSEGGKRAAKNVLNIIAFAENLETHPDKIHLAGGVTKATINMNIIDSNGFGLEHYFSGRCYTGKYNKMECLYIQTKTGLKVIVVAGGKDADDYRSIKGNSYGSIYITEANECHKVYIKEAMDRTIASTKRKIFFDLNPKPPKHWFYDEILDYQDELKERGENPGYNYAHFTIWNNLSISNEQIRTVTHTYDKTSMWYIADILGKRTAGTGRIYTAYKRNECIVNAKTIREKIKPMNFSIGVDVGGTDATCATLVGFGRGYIDTVLLDGYYDKQGKETGKTHNLYAKEIVNKIVEWVEQYPQVSASPVFAESADKLFRQSLANELVKRGLTRMLIVPSYKKEGIVDRIRLTNILLQQGRYFIANHLKKWIEAIENAMWSDDDYEKGDWVRIDDGSYPVDCLDSSEYGQHPYKLQLLKGVR